jgi:hypothetical protein
VTKRTMKPLKGAKVILIYIYIYIYVYILYMYIVCIHTLEEL